VWPKVSPVDVAGMISTVGHFGHGGGFLLTTNRGLASIQRMSIEHSLTIG